MMVHVHGESQPRGETPLNTLFKLGKYEIKLLDPSARYGEATKELNVDSKSKQELFVKMNKIVSFKVRSKDNANDVFLTKVKIYNQNYSVTKEISTSKPIRVSLPVDVYNVLFYGDNEYKNSQLYNIDINNISSVVGELEYNKVSLKLTIRSTKNEKPLANAFIWLNNKAIGRTDKTGIFESKYKPGKYDFKIVATGHDDQVVSVDLIAGRKNAMDVLMRAEKHEEPVVETPKEQTSGLKINSAIPSIGKGASNDEYNDVDSNDTIRQPVKKQEEPKKEEVVEEDSGGAEQEVIVCLNCGYVNTAPKGKKLRFCVNCAKPLK
jgi:hypothetical protein